MTGIVTETQISTCRIKMEETFIYSYILRVVLVIIMEFHWLIGRVLQRRTMYDRVS